MVAFTRIADYQNAEVLLPFNPCRVNLHPQERGPVLFRLDGQVVNFIGIVVQIEQLNVVVLEDLLQRPRRIERRWRVVTAELVAPIEHK